MLIKSVRYIFANIKKHNFYNVRNYSLNVNEVIETKRDVEERLLKVAIIGTPNAGKSTFINNLMDRKVCATSSKVHTTRTKSRAIFTVGNSQIIFLDTPGLVNQRDVKRYKLERSFSKDCKACLEDADVVGVIHDVSHIATRERLDLKVIYLLEKFPEKQSFLILNKVDLLKSKRKLLDVTRLLTENCINGKLMPNCAPLKNDPNRNKGYRNFQDIFMVSALTGNGLSEVKDYLVGKSKPGKWLYPEIAWTDQTAESVIVNRVKAKFLDYLKEELPYTLKVEMEFFEINEQGVIKCVVLAKCPSERIANLIAGTNNGRIRQIIESVQSELQHAFQNFVRINVILQGPSDSK